jgi:hypothetical protein
MRKLFFLLTLLVGFTSVAQTSGQLKKRFLGTYTGFIPSYKTVSSNIQVDSVALTIELSSNQLRFSLGKLEFEGEYTILLETASYYILECKMEDRIANERIMVYKRGKKISRDGLFPQPNATLYKLRKKKRNQ